MLFTEYNSVHSVIIRLQYFAYILVEAFICVYTGVPVNKTPVVFSSLG